MLVAWVALAVSLTGAASAQGARKVITVSDTVSAPQRVVMTALASCPRGSNVVGGGFFTAADPQPVIVEASHRLGQRSWVAKGLREDEPGTLTAYAYCRRGAARMKQRTSTVPIAVGPLGGQEAGTARATCPLGRKAVAGGFEAEVDTSTPSSPKGVLVARSSRSGKRSWSTTGTHAVDNLTLDITSFVYCLVRKRPRRTAATTVEDQNSAIVDTPRCRRRALSGGFRGDPFQLGSDRNAVLVTESRRLGKSWRTTGTHLGSTGTATLTGFGYCG